MHYDPPPAPGAARHPAAGRVRDPPAGGSAERRPRRAVAGVRPRRSWRLSAAAAARLPRDQAHLVAQHRGRWPTAGYEVIAPDLRGYGDSDLSADDVYDLAAWSRDVYLLVHDVLGHERCGVVGGDIGGVVGGRPAAPLPGLRRQARLLRHRAADRLRRLRRRRASTSPRSARIGDGPTGDYRYLQGATPDELAAELDTAGQAPALHRRACTATGCGRRPARSPPPTSTS